MCSDLTEFWNEYVERCGFVLRDGGILEVPNVHENPQEGFRIAPEVILEHEGKVAATWHTHPHHGANLSVEDYQCFLRWPEWGHFIVHRGKVQYYYVEQNRVLCHASDIPRLPEKPLPGGAA